MKKITFVMAMVFAMVMNVSARTIYLDANIWAVDNPKFSAWAWAEGADGAAYEFTLVEGTIFQSEIPDAATGIIFLRNDPAKFDIMKPWDAEWNRAQTGIPTDGNDMFRIVDWKEDPACEPSETVPHCPSKGVWTKFGTAVAPEADVVVKVQKPADWAGIAIWAWNSGDVDWMAQFTAWPGVALTEIGNDWYQFTVKENAWFMFNDGQADTSVKTAAAQAKTATCYTVSTEKNTNGEYILEEADCENVNTAINQVIVDKKGAVKFMQNGQLFIQMDGKTYNALGTQM